MVWLAGAKTSLITIKCGSCSSLRANLEDPIKDMDPRDLDLLLNGTGLERVTYKIVGPRRRRMVTRPFPGIVNRLLKRYNETDSSAVQDEIIKYMSYKNCQSCDGARLQPHALCIKINQSNIADLCHYSIDQVAHWFSNLTRRTRQHISSKISKEINDRLALQSVGLNYLSLERRAPNLSGGEAQRIHLASQIGSGLVGVTYVLDEPSIGLHQRDNQRLLESLFHQKTLAIM